MRKIKFWNKQEDELKWCMRIDIYSWFNLNKKKSLIIKQGTKIAQTLPTQWPVQATGD